MTKLHRKELKQDEIRETMVEAVRSVSLHRREILYIVLLVGAVFLIAFGWYFYERKQNAESQNLLGIALEKYNAPVGEQPAAPVKPAYVFKTETEKYSAALKDFEQVIEKYGNTPAAEMARYMAGVSAFYLKDLKKAEDCFRQAGNVSERNILYYQSRMALANLYLKSEKPDEAIKILSELSNKKGALIPTDFVLMQLAESYEKAGKKKEAKDTYQRILDEFKESTTRFQAQMKLDQLK